MKLYLCYKNETSNICETFPAEDAAFARMSALDLDDNNDVGLFDDDEKDTAPLPVGTYETEDYIVIYKDGTGNMTWTLVKSAQNAFSIAAKKQDAVIFNVMTSQF